MKRTTYRPKQYQPRACSCGRGTSSSEVLVGPRTLHLCSVCVDQFWRTFMAERAGAK